MGAMTSKGHGIPTGLKPKDLVGIPWRVAFALQADGWYLRSDIIWCLSGGTRVYARTQKGEMPATLKDLVRLDPSTVQLWNGDKWTQVLGWSQADSRDGGIEIELRTGERIGCTPHHRWPTERGEVAASDLKVGDVVLTTGLPEPSDTERGGLADDDVGWFVGMYLAEGSRSNDTLQFAGHINDPDRFRRLARIARAFDGTCRVHQTSENGVTTNINGPVLDGILRAYIVGDDAYTKHLTSRAWQRSDAFLRGVLAGYLQGDGYRDTVSYRWRLGFTRNDALAADLRTIGARLGESVRLRRSKTGWRGEVRMDSFPRRTKDGEIVAIRRSRARKFWHVGVADAPHTFALASGVLTCNSKPNPMPESVTDRPTKAHEYLFLLAKSERYYFDADAVREPNEPSKANIDRARLGLATRASDKDLDLALRAQGGNGRNPDSQTPYGVGGRNIRSVWTIATQPYPGAHFATFPRSSWSPASSPGPRSAASARSAGHRGGGWWSGSAQRSRRPAALTDTERGATTADARNSSALPHPPPVGDPPAPTPTPRPSRPPSSTRSAVAGRRRWSPSTWDAGRS
jgi:hypothetical protein